MAGSDKDSTIDTILRNLTDRPKVESTLILSSKDGSIIKTAGFAGAERRRRALSSAPDPASQTKDGLNGSEEAVAEQERHTPVEELAASIFQFMKAAGSMGLTLAEVSARQDQEDSSAFRTSQTERDEKGAAESSDKTMERQDSQVQLLRLRMKSREVIIYPDTHYLCCVVQRIGKRPTRAGR